jgi:3-hydroxybutyrate dehydrogenase
MSVGGKCVVVTGSNSGIGLGVAKELARLGANVVLNSFSDSPEDHALARRIADEHEVRVVYIQADMSNGDQCRRLVDDANDALGRVDILVNNAGVQFVSPIPDFPAGKWDQITSSTVTGVPSENRASGRRENSTQSRSGPVSIDSASNP